MLSQGIVDGIGRWYSRFMLFSNANTGGYVTGYSAAEIRGGVTHRICPSGVRKAHGS